MATSSTFVDFDAAWAEFDFDGFILPVPADPTSEFTGDEVPMPATMPAGFRLHMWRVRQERGDDAELGYAELSVAASFLFGRERLSHWYEQRISEAALTTAVQLAMAEYRQRDPQPAESDGQGKAGPPASEVPPT